ncbi:hypothetical protein EIM50_22115 [Pseudoxanthomonas sp. SGD-10]|nr:hypothetical protein EIM50_22115 [Pseudoxanthomonas sp. SGD-10]
MIAETLKPHDRHFNKVDVLLIGSNQIAVNSAIKEAEKLGYHTYSANRLITGDTEKEAQNLVHKLLSNTYQKPFCVVQGGETVIKVTGNGKGGRNQHFALAALAELRSIYASLDVKELILLSCGTDGTDGPTDAAGAIINLEMVKKDLNFEPYLKNHDSYSFFSNTGSLIKTGPTQTNVMDIQIMIVV